MAAEEVRDDRVDVLMSGTPGTWQDDPVDGAGSRGRGFIALTKQDTLEHMPRVSGSRGHSLGSFRTQGEGAGN